MSEFTDELDSGSILDTFHDLIELKKKVVLDAEEYLKKSRK